MKRTKKRNYVIVALVVILLAIAVGYAAFQTVLTVSGTATGASFTWDVHFDSSNTKIYEVTSAGTKGSEITDSSRASVSVGSATAATSSTAGSQTATVSVTLTYPGDAVLLETVIVNGSSQPVTLTGFTVSGAENGLLISTPNEDPIVINSDEISVSGTCTAQFLIKWDPTVADLSSQNFTITFTYSQQAEKNMNTIFHEDI